MPEFENPGQAGPEIEASNLEVENMQRSDLVMKTESLEELIELIKSFDTITKVRKNEKKTYTPEQVIEQITGVQKRGLSEVMITSAYGIRTQAMNHIRKEASSGIK